MIAIPEFAQAGRFHRSLYQRLFIQGGDRQAGSPEMLTYRIHNAEPQW